MIPPLVLSTEGLLRGHEGSLDIETRALELELNKLEDEHKAKRAEMQLVQEDVKRRLEMRTKLQEEISRAEAHENKYTRIRRQAKRGTSKTQQVQNDIEF